MNSANLKLDLISFISKLWFRFFKDLSVIWVGIKYKKINENKFRNDLNKFELFIL